MAIGGGRRHRTGEPEAGASNAPSDVVTAAKKFAGTIGVQSADLADGALAAASAAVLELPVPTPQTPWRVGLAQLIAAQLRVPSGAARLLGVLDRFGSLSLTPDELGFDGETVCWHQVQGLTVAPVRDVLTGKAIQHELDRLLNLLPPIPGRKWAIQQVADTVIGIAVAAVRLDQLGGDALAHQVPSSVTAKGRLRTTTTSPGLFAILVMAARPDVADAVIAAATVRKIPVTADPPSTVHERADSMTALAASVRESLLRRRPATMAPGRAPGS